VFAHTHTHSHTLTHTQHTHNTRALPPKRNPGRTVVEELEDLDLVNGTALVAQGCEHLHKIDPADVLGGVSVTSGFGARHARTHTTHTHTHRHRHTHICTHTPANTQIHILTHIQHTAHKHTNTHAHTDLELLEADDESDDEIGALLRPGKHNLTRAVLPIVSWAKDKLVGMVQTHAHICVYTCKALAQTERER
jgi:hypothetical protein